MEHTKDTFDLYEVDPGIIIENGTCLRTLSSHHWTGSYNQLINDPELTYICAGKHFTYSDSTLKSLNNDILVKYEWYLYKYDGKIWFRNKVNGEIAEQGLYV